MPPPRKRAPPPEDRFPFELLPVECQLHVLSFLGEADKCSCALVCCGWSRLVRSWKLWRVADYCRRGAPPAGRGGLLVSNREFEKWRSWVHLYTHHLISRGASLLTLRASFDLGDRRNGWGELLRHLLDNVHCGDLGRLDLDWTFTLLEPLDVRVHAGSQRETKTKMDQVRSPAPPLAPRPLCRHSLSRRFQGERALSFRVYVESCFWFIPNRTLGASSSVVLTRLFFFCGSSRDVARATSRDLSFLSVLGGTRVFVYRVYPWFIPSKTFPNFGSFFFCWF